MNFIKLHCLRPLYKNSNDWYIYDDSIVVNIDIIKLIKKSSLNFISNFSDQNDGYELVKNINLDKPFTEVQILCNNEIKTFIVAESEEQIIKMIRRES